MSTLRDITSNNSLFSDGKYEILYCTGIHHSLEDTPSTIVQSLNGANVNCENVDLKCKVNWQEKYKIIESISFLMPRDDAYLKDIFTTLPYGLIKKNRTGIGATTLELSSPRNSIVVVPTRALAYEKAKSSRIRDTNRYSILYIGGSITGFNIPSVEDYLSDNEIKNKKFIVVVDSLPSLLDKIGEEHFKDYFIMFDEIDSYQYDSSFRPNMEQSFDYYFKFPDTKRCLVSATVGKFSNVRIEEEPIINVTFNSPAPRSIRLIHTNDVLTRTQKVIEQLSENFPDDKILIALNLVTRGMLPIINSLPEERQAQCGILCSSKSKQDVALYYKEVINRELPSRITFMSCTYFVGIDIDERFHLISVADVRYPFTLLSTDKLSQIAGRCRHKDGLLSETVIYNTYNQSNDIDYSLLEQEIISDANLLSIFAHSIREVRYKFPKLIRKFNDISENEILENSHKAYHGSSHISLVRQTGDKIVPAYFNIDNIIIQVKHKNTLYSQTDNLYRTLKEEGNNIEITYIKKEENAIPQEVYDEIEEQCALTTEEERESLISQLRERNTLEERAALAQSLKNDCKRVNSTFLEHFIEMQKYVLFDKLVEILPLNDNAREYNKLYNSVLIWALDEGHPIKITLKTYFPIGNMLTSEEITTGVNVIWNSTLQYGVLPPVKAVQTLKTLFCKVGERTSSYRNRKKINVYPILSYDVLGLNCEPIERIPASQSLTRMLRA